jgi:hypothetical protein
MEDILRSALGVLRTTPQRWMSLAEIHPELFRRKPAPKEWSALDCLKHVVDTERMVFPQRIGHLLRGEDFPDFSPDRDGAKTVGDLKPAEWAREFSRLRWESLAILSRIEPSDLNRKARHRELGMVTLGELIHEWAGHDLMHTVQAERAILQPFIEGCGPWKPYFADHVIAGKS